MTPKLSPERKTPIELIVKLLALAESSPYASEAQTARETALRLMAEHDIRAGETQEQPFEAREYGHGRSVLAGPYFRRDVWYERQFRFAVAKLNNCLYLVSWLDHEGQLIGSSILVARRGDLDEYMVGIALRQRTEAWNRNKAKGGDDGNAKWLGYARGVEDKVDGLLEDIAARMSAQGGNALAPLSLIAEAQNWFGETYGPLGDHPYHNHRGRHSQAGHAAGRNVRFYRREVGAPAQRLPAPR